MRIIIIFLLLVSCSSPKCIESSKPLTETERLSSIEAQLRQYGKQNLTGDKIMLVQFGIVAIGAGLSIPAVPLLVATGVCNLANIIVSKKADKQLSKYHNEKN